MTTTTRPSTAVEHAAEARRLLGLIRPDGLSPEEYSEYLAFDNSAAIVAAAQVHATLALVEEQRTANKIAAFQAELIVNPHGVGTHEHDKWWVDFGTPITEAVQR